MKDVCLFLNRAVSHQKFSHGRSFSFCLSDRCDLSLRIFGCFVCFMTLLSFYTWWTLSQVGGYILPWTGSMEVWSLGPFKVTHIWLFTRTVRSVEDFLFIVTPSFLFSFPFYLPLSISCALCLWESSKTETLSSPSPYWLTNFLLYYQFSLSTSGTRQQNNNKRQIYQRSLSSAQINKALILHLIRSKSIDL